MSKHYTPEIEEFHKGFEYGFSHSGKDWETRSIPATAYIDYNIFPEEKIKDMYRCKHLDREDIESLGAVITEDVHGGKHPSYDRFLIKRLDLDDFIIMFNYTDNWLTVNTVGNNDDCRFYGEVKNKSELKRILKQIGV